MKDKQIPLSNAEPRIFLVSAVLHCVCMTGLVFLRSSFGFGYLRPKSVFFAFSWAFILYAIYAWVTESVWREHRALIVFGASALCLYWLHLIIALIREWTESGEHEQYSGIPHPIRLMRLAGWTASTNLEANLRLWGEPATVLVLAVLFRLTLGRQGLLRWLLLLALCLWSKETFNRWSQLRLRKRQKDIFADTEETVEQSTVTHFATEPPKTTRKARIKRARIVTDASPD